MSVQETIEMTIMQNGQQLENKTVKKIFSKSTIPTKVTLSADDTLRSYVEEMIHVDKRFVGMSRYIYDVNFYWSYSISTACAGYGFIFFNPEFWDKLSEEKKKTVIAHEIWHLILEHLERGEGLDPDTYNQAADHVINIGLNADGFDMDGEFGDITPCFDRSYTGMSTEVIYSRILKEKKNNSDTAPKGVPGTPSKDQIEDLVKEALEDTGTDLQQQKEEDKEAIDKCVPQAPPGSQPSGEHILIQSKNKKVFIQNKTYNEIFEKYFTDPLSGGKRTFMRPSCRQIKGGLRLKGKYPKKGRANRLTHLVYALDVSGSITGHQRTQFLRSAKTLKEKLNPLRMTIILWDTKIVFEKVFREDEVLDNISIHAGGGTCLDPVYKRVAEINPEALVIFTDMQVTIPPKPSWETIWFVPSKSCPVNRVTYGQVYLVPEDTK